MSSRDTDSKMSLQSLLTLQTVLAALLAYLVIRTHEYFPEENGIVVILKFSLVVVFLMLILVNALA